MLSSRLIFTASSFKTRVPTTPLLFIKKFQCSSKSPSSPAESLIDKKSQPDTKPTQKKRKTDDDAEEEYFKRRANYVFSNPAPGQIVQPSAIPGGVHMQVIDLQDNELDQNSNDAVRQKQAQRRKQEQDVIMTERLRHAKWEKIITWFLLIGCCWAIGMFVPQFVTSFKNLMVDRFEKPMYGPAEKPENYEYGSAGQNPYKNYMAGHEDASVSMFMNDKSAFRTGNFKNNNNSVSVPNNK